MSEEGKKLLIKMHSYRITGIIFMVIGVFVFAQAYTSMADGDFTKILKAPFMIIWIVSPFLPCSIMFWLYGRAEKKLTRLLEQTDKSA